MTFRQRAAFYRGQGWWHTERRYECCVGGRKGFRAWVARIILRRPDPDAHHFHRWEISLTRDDCTLTFGNLWDEKLSDEDFHRSAARLAQQAWERKRES